MDARVRYTKMMIENSMIEMLKELPIEKITVRALCERAQINRSTFYKHYDNPYDLLDKITTERHKELEMKLRAGNHNDLAFVFRTVLLDVQEHYALYKLLFTTVGDDHFRQILFDLCYGPHMETVKHLFADLPDAKKEWVYFFIADGCNSVFQRWLEGGMKEDPEEVVHHLETSIKCINQYLPRML